MAVTASDILSFLAESARRPLDAGDILAGIGISKKERRKVLHLLETMAEEGTLVRLKGGRYCLPARVDLVTGTVSAHRDGYGFVSPASGEGADVFVPARYMRELMDGDRVVVRVEGGRYGKLEGRPIQVLERAHSTIVGRYEQVGRLGCVVPLDPRIGQDIFIPEGEGAGAVPGQLVLARILNYPSKTRSPDGRVVEILGEPDDPEVEVRTIVHKHGLPYIFPAEVAEEAERVPAEVGEEEIGGREDLRSLPLVTIDGETAKDFDDAVAVRRESSGEIRLWVAIADVGHYVPAASPIDVEAYERSTSVYFPGRCIPMLPEALSNGICSLNPGVDRLAMTAELLFDEEGERVESRFYPSVIRSAARLTYTEVREMVVDGEETVIERYEELVPQLKVMEELTGRLMAMRSRRGSLDFDLPEAEVVLDLRGRPEDVVRSERNLAHRMIEEMMLAANEAVASFLVERGAPFLYRIHEPPERVKLEAFQQFVAQFNYGLVLGKKGVDSFALQKLLREAEGSHEERMLNQVLLRSMKQARYDSENLGHFGLAADPYCHFTSPIRRYPDLVVHRILREVLEGGLFEPRKTHLDRVLPAMGEHTSGRERRAMEAEREIVDLKKCQFMADKVGEEFDGLVSSVVPFGFFVELNDVFVEGLVHISSLGDDFYHYEQDLHRLIGENRRRVFQVGSEVRVKVAKVNPERREIDFALAGGVDPSDRRKKVYAPRGKKEKMGRKRGRGLRS